MRLLTITLQKFRCFEKFSLDITQPLVLIEGDNGSGKTSLLEAIHYVCYLKSFRTHLYKELLYHEAQASYVAATFINQDSPLEHCISVGTGTERLVKLDETPVKQYRQIVDHFRVITLTEDDLWLIKSGPDARRSFIDQYLVLHKPEYLATLRQLKQVVQQRNAVLQQPLIDKGLLQVWTQQLWELSVTIAQERERLLTLLCKEVNVLFATYFQMTDVVQINYLAKKVDPHAPWSSTESLINSMIFDEQRLGRSLFGAHLDDFQITFCDHNSRAFASRGQQKLVVLLLKIAQLQYLMQDRGPSIFLLDDFMTDFDEQKVARLLPLLMSLQGQLIFTTPLTNSVLKTRLLENNAQVIAL